MTDRELMQQALEALEADDSKLWPNDKRTKAITALSAAIEQAQPTFDRNVVLLAINDLNEVDAVLEDCRVKRDVGTDRANAVLCSLLKSLDGAYLQPEQEPRQWQGLTGAEIDEITDQQFGNGKDAPLYAAHRSYALDIEHKLRLKNS